MEIAGWGVAALCVAWGVVLGPFVLSTWLRSMGLNEWGCATITAAVAGAFALVVGVEEACATAVCVWAVVAVFESKAGWRGVP